MSQRKQSLFWVIMVFSVLLFFEGLSIVAIWMLSEWNVRPTSKIFKDQSQKIQEFLNPDRPHMIEIHPHLGWRYRPNYSNQSHRLNSIALRSAREYDPRPRQKVLRVAAFGDSFVYGSEVDNFNAWPTLMENADPYLEVLNYGVGGYGVDQAYLRYTLEGAALSPHVVIMGFTPADLARVVNVYRRFLDGRDLVLFKPRFYINERGELTLMEAPIRSRKDYELLLANPREVLRYGAHDDWYQKSVYKNPLYDYSATIRLGLACFTKVYHKYWNPDGLFNGLVFNTSSTAFRLHVALFKRFTQAAYAADALPLVIMLPDQASVRRASDGQPPSYQPLLAVLKEENLPCLDGINAFVGNLSDTKSWFAPHGHYSAEGNKIVAAWLRQEIWKFVGSSENLDSQLRE